MAKLQKFDAAKAVEQVKKDKRLMLVMGGGILLLIGMFLPWITIDFGDTGGILGSSLNRSLNGLDANSFFPIILLVVAAASALNVANQSKKNAYLGSIIAAGLAFLIVLIDWPDTGGTLGSVSIGIGYYLSFVGSAARTVGAGLLFKDNMKSDTDNKKQPEKEEK